MGLGISQLAASERLTAWGTKYKWVKYHVGDPGTAGTTNPATETDRVEVTWDTPSTAVAGVVTMTHTNDLELTNVAGTEDYTHGSVWSASSGGDFGGSGLITADPVAATDDFILTTGSLIVTQPTAS
jgi:hypothetical protein